MQDTVSFPTPLASESVPVCVPPPDGKTAERPRTTWSPECERFSVLGVRFCNITRRRAIQAIEETIRSGDASRSLFFANAHTLNLAAADPTYRDVLNAADAVFADGTGVRWAARLHGVRILANMVGTDFVPQLFEETAGRGYCYFMLGSDPQTVAAAADYARYAFSGWRLAGYHHGFAKDDAAVMEKINALRPDVLLVGMGNPIQEQWIHEHKARLNVPAVLGIGGLFDYWAGNVSRAPAWIRRLGHEWLWRLYQQPVLKAKRYLIGNPLFIARVLCEYRTDAACSNKNAAGEPTTNCPSD